MSADRVDQFRADIEASPDALARLLDDLEVPGLGGRRRFLFTGLGSSGFAAQLVAAQVQHHGATAWVESALTSAATPPAVDIVLFAISASGRTPAVIQAAAAHRGRSLVVAVTNDPGSALADVADQVIRLEAGVESAGIAARSFRATIAALALTTGIVDAPTLRTAIDGLVARLSTADAWAAPIVDALDGAPAIDVLADASQLGLAAQAALMLREAPRLPAHAFETADWLHTGVYLAWAGHQVLSFAGSAADDEVATTLARRGAGQSIVPAQPGDAISRAIVDSVVAEVVAERLWRRADGR